MIHIRRAHDLDARDMAAILSGIIALGGTTAITGPIRADDIRAWMSSAPDASAWHVAETSDGQILGFQWIEPADALPADTCEIATFAKPGRQGIGIGSMLFEATRTAARALGYRRINARIRADNAGGLAYYQSRGFEACGRIDRHLMDDGRIVALIVQSYDLT